MVLAVFVVIFAIVGLGSAFRWVPETLLLAASVLVPTVILLVTGHRAGAWAGALAGAIAGLTGGVVYVVSGKPAINIPILLVAGLVGGLVLGALGGVARSRGSGSSTR